MKQQNISGSYRTKDGQAQIDFELEYKDGKPVFSATGECGGGMGQCLDTIGTTYPDDPIVQTLVGIWRDYHLNDVRAGCEHQRAEHWGDKELTVITSAEPPKPEPGRVYPSQAALASHLKGWVQEINPTSKTHVFIGGHNGIFGGIDGYWRIVTQLFERFVVKADPADERVKWFTETFGTGTIKTEKKLSNWVRQDEHPEGVLCKPCPVCGYPYGSEWKYQPIPEDVLVKLQALAAQPAASLPPLHRDLAKQWLIEHGLQLRITRSDTKAAPWETAGHHYRVTLIREATKGAKGRLTFDFWGSQNMAEDNTDPAPYDILACISSDVNTADTFEDYCNEYGEDSDSIKAKQTFTRADRFARKLRAFLTDEEQRSIQTIR